MNDYLLTFLFTLVLGAGNSVYHGDQLLKTEEAHDNINNSNFFIVTNILKIILTPVILYVGYLIAKRSLFLLFVGIVLNVAPLINALIILVANVFVIPISILIAKLLRLKI